MIKELWVPDEEGRGCALCHLDFSVTKRRHHCRKCGALVCGSCSDHFVVLPTSNDSEVRICDKCEAELRQGIGDTMDVTAQITDSLKLALKEKAAEEELYQNLSHRLGTETVESICDKYQSVTREYNEVKMDSVELERQIRSMAQRCLKAEEVAREGLNTARQIEDLSGKIGAQSRLIDQLTERIQRLSERREISPISRPAPPSSLQVTTLTSNQASVCLTLKSLIGLDHL